jgi:hypothetical protein
MRMLLLVSITTSSYMRILGYNADTLEGFWLMVKNTREKTTI